MTSRQALRCEDSRDGLSVHLRGLADDRALCGVQTARTSTAYFALIGCRRCAARARKLGYTCVVDTDGEEVDLDIQPG